MTRRPSFSIVTPSFNQAAFIRDAIESVRAQRYGDVEHIVIDGKSIDGTVDILRRYSLDQDSKHLHWISETDRGQSHALNKGFALASGDIVGWLNSDDRYLPDCFDHVVRAFAKYPEIDILYGDYRWIHENGRLYRTRREIEFSPFILLYHRVLYIPTTATFFHRRVFDAGHYLNEDLHYALDFEFFVRLMTSGCCFRHIPVMLGEFRFQKNSKTCTAPHKQAEEQRQIAEKYSPVLSSIQSPAARKMLRAALGASAAALRYSEKLLRGYYFDESLRVPALLRARNRASCIS